MARCVRHFFWCANSGGRMARCARHFFVRQLGGQDGAIRVALLCAPTRGAGWRDMCGTFMRANSGGRTAA
eukprot:6591516-Alexandrium_andersonii.AAC.1